MQFGMIGLGRMGGAMVQRCLRGGHDCVAFDVNSEAVQSAVQYGATLANSLEDLVLKLTEPRLVWIMLPAALVERTVAALTPLLSPGDIIIDGGNSHYADDIARSARLSEAGIHYLDCGVSGGVWGLERGYCLMVGGDSDAVKHVTPLFETLAPGVESAPRTPGKSGEPSESERGWVYCGGSGAGHFVKMVHNGIEYGLMAAYAEGINILRHADVGLRQQVSNAENAPLKHPELYTYRFPLAEIAEAWRRGSVISSWLLDLSALALSQDEQLAQFSGRVSDSGEGRWTIDAAIDESVPVHVLAAALFERFSSRGEAEYQDRLLSAMRHAFGGHQEQKG